MSILSKSILLPLLTQCGNGVAPETLNSLITVESGRNPYAVAIVWDKGLKENEKFKFKQPQSFEDAKILIDQIKASKVIRSYSVGLMQVNSSNFNKYSLGINNMFDSCTNIKAGSDIFKGCYVKAKNTFKKKTDQELLRIASSCYYSGNEYTVRKFKSLIKVF